MDDAGLDQAPALDGGLSRDAHLNRQSGIGLSTVDHEVVQHLMGGLNTRWGDVRRHVLIALTRIREVENGPSGRRLA